MMEFTDKESKLLDGFASDMKNLYGPTLVALYVTGEGGSLGSGAKSGPKLLAVMGMIGQAELKKYLSISAGWQKKGISAPLMLTKHTLETSCDVFPIEFLEMKEQNHLLYGDDVLAALSISHENLRRQCEEQVKGKLIHLRQGYIDAEGKPEGVTALIAASIPHFAEVMRNILRLGGGAAPAGKGDAITRFCAMTGIESGPFTNAMDIRAGRLKPAKDGIDPVYSEYLSVVEKMAEYVDGMAG